MPESIPSQAFAQATLRSERRRTLGLLAIVAGFLVLNGLRLTFFHHSGAETQRFITYILFWLVCGSYEGVVLFVTIRGERSNRPLRAWMPYVNTTLECLFPSIAVLGQTVD